MKKCNSPYINYVINHLQALKLRNCTFNVPLNLEYIFGLRVAYVFAKTLALIRSKLPWSLHVNH